MKVWKMFAGFLIAMLIGSCSNQSSSTASDNSNSSSSIYTGEYLADPGADYATVFPDNKVNRLDITIDSTEWKAMLADMESKYGAFGSKSSQTLQKVAVGGNPPQEAIDACVSLEPSDACTVNMPTGEITGTCLIMNDSLVCVPENQPGGTPTNADVENPIWAPATVQFEGSDWKHVGIRFKGNSSLSGTWQSGNWKMPLKLDFDQYEDEYPETKDQRFFGIKQLSLSSNIFDNSLLHEKIAADIFRFAGVPAPQTAFYRIYINHGGQSQYFGLYTGVEVPNGPMMRAQFGASGGNLYKPEGGNATQWIEGSNLNAESFEKQNHESDADWSDVQAAFTALHADQSDLVAWRSNLEAVFNVDLFLRWLAVNTVMQNWDTYGVMGHNYLLYASPLDQNQLKWIPWDNNEALQSEHGMGKFVDLDLQNVDDSWPLITLLRDDPVYYQQYIDDVAYFDSTVFTTDFLQTKFQEAHDLIAPYVTGVDGEEAGYTLLANPSAFESSVSELMAHVASRKNAVSDFLK